ncbi:hypothetical protein HanRHA438_Chr15g0705851 [Helianthus annuus]|nr:hypothetical protein HanRHA438_Chr15g0705851 [Helianthus annuus]
MVRCRLYYNSCIVLPRITSRLPTHPSHFHCGLGGCRSCGSQRNSMPLLRSGRFY